MEGDSVFVVCNFEPLRIGLCRVVRDSVALHLAGFSATLAEARRDASNSANVTYLIDSGQVAELMDVDERLPDHPFQRVVFVGPVPPTHDPGAVLAHQLRNRRSAGFLLEIGATSRLVAAISLVASGAFVCEMNMAHGLRADDPNIDLIVRLRNAALSGRECQVLARVARGRVNKEIARELSLAEGTIKAHVSHVLGKLGLQHRLELVRFGSLLSDEGEFMHSG